MASPLKDRRLAFNVSTALSNKAEKLKKKAAKKCYFVNHFKF